MGLGSIIGDVIGGAAGAIGFNQVHQRAKGQKGAIKRAYQMATLQNTIDQANTRQDTNESLNARGVLAAGAPQSSRPLSPIAASVAKSGAYRDLYTRAQAGNTGASNTLGGQVNANLGDQFYRESKDLYDNKEQALNDVKASEMNGYLQSAIGGVQTALNVATGMNTGGTMGAIQGAFGMPVNLQPSAAVMPSPSVPSTGATGTLPRSSGTLSGSSDVSNYNFNVG